jgi:phage terminase large subunit-like protein
VLGSFLPGVTPQYFDGLSDEDREILDRYLRAELRKMEQDPLTYGHPPHAVQEELHCAEEDEVMLVASNRLGKTEGGMRECLWRARGNHPYRQLRRHRVIWIGCPTYNFYEETTRPKFDQWCPADWIVDFNDTKRVAVLRHEDGGVCKLHFKTYDQGRARWQGAGVDHIWLDEEPPEDVFREAYARIISTRGSIHLTFTAVEGLGWWYERIYVPAKQRKGRWRVIEGALAEYDESAYLNIGRILVPHLAYEDVVRFAEAYPDLDERLTRVFGQPRSRSGAVYKSFRPEIHTIPAFPIPDHWELWGAVDPGYHGFAFLLLAISPDGRIYVIDEYFSQQEITSARLKEMVRRVRRARKEPGHVPVYVDTEDPQVVLELNVQAADTSAPLGFKSLEQGLKARKAGILRVQEYFAPNPKRATPKMVTRPRMEGGEPLLYLFDSLHSVWTVNDEPFEGSRLAYEVVRYQWKKRSADRRDDADEASADGAHALAALRYGLAARVGLPEESTSEKYSDLTPLERAVWEEVDRIADGRAPKRVHVPG